MSHDYLNSLKRIYCGVILEATENETLVLFKSGGSDLQTPE